MTSMKHIAVILVLTAAILIAGCGSLVRVPGSSGETVSRDSGLSYGIPVPVPTFAPASKVAAEQSMGGTNAGQGVEMKIIKTGQVTIEVSQVPAAIDQIRNIAAANGGYLSSSNVYSQENDRKTGYAMIRIPAERFDAVMQSLEPLGKVLSRSESRSDVTEQYVDLTIQNESYHNQLENYYRLMDRATEVEDIIRIQTQIDRITMELNRIEGQLRYLDSQIDLSTITVSLQEPEPVGGTSYNMIESVNAGIAAFFGMISALIVLVFAAIPLIIVGLVLYVIYRWYRKRRGGAAVVPVPAPTETKV